MDVVYKANKLTPGSSIVEDPMAPDQQDDHVVVTTRRGLSRIAFVAAETASRFEREGIGHDPVAWMMTPRKIFEGSAAIDACLDRHAFMRAAILHGLSWGLDASPEEIDPLINDDDEDELEQELIEHASVQPGLPAHHSRTYVTRTDPTGRAISSCRMSLHRARSRHVKCSRAPRSARRSVPCRKTALCPSCFANRGARP